MPIKKETRCRHPDEREEKSPEVPNREKGVEEFTCSTSDASLRIYWGKPGS